MFIELGEYDISYEPKLAIKAQALADFIVELTRNYSFDHKYEFDNRSVWNLFLMVYLIEKEAELVYCLRIQKVNNVLMLSGLNSELLIM